MATAVVVALAGGWYLVVDELPDNNDLSVPTLLTGVALVVVVPGLVAEWRRPRDPTAWLVVVVGLATVDADLRLLHSSWAATVGAAIFFALPLAVCHLLLALPDGLGPRRSRVVLATWVAPAALAAATLVLTGPRHTVADLRTGGLRASTWNFNIEPEQGPTRWWRPGNPLHRVDSDAALRTVWALWSVLVVVVAVATVVALARRGAGTRPSERRAARLVLGAGVAVAAGMATLPLTAFPERVRLDGGAPIGSVVLGHWYADLVNVAPALAAAVVGGVLVWGELLRPRLSRRTDGAIQLGTAPSLERALGDATARVLFPTGDGWVDDRGRPAEPATSAGRAATVVTRDGVPVAAVEHDEWLLSQPDLLDVAVTSVARTLEGRRLAAVATAGTEDIQTSATRLLDAAERARRDVEARIADGPDRTLAGVATLLTAEPVPLDAVHAALRDAVAQVREIAHGLAPDRLADEGLAGALDELDVTVDALPDRALPPALELTAYLVAAAAPTGSHVEVTQHDDAVAVRVRDWAGPLDQLLEDRVRGLDGTVAVEAGSLTVTLPLAGE
jgi:hypothetical protein